jgi:hypothetical protein
VFRIPGSGCSPPAGAGVENFRVMQSSVHQHCKSPADINVEIPEIHMQMRICLFIAKFFVLP